MVLDPTPEAFRPPEEVEAERCANCDAGLAGPYCAHCGQPRAERIALGRVVADLKDQFTGLDFRIVRTFRDLYASPGTMLRSYLDGRRIAYTNPFQLLFVAASIYLLSVTVLDTRLGMGPESDETAGIVVAFLNYLVYLFLVPTAWFQQLLFRRSRLTWAESYVVLVYLWAGYLLLSAALAPLLASLGRGYLFGRTAVGLVYVVLATRSFHGLRWWPGLWRGALLYATYFVSTGVIMALVITLAHLVGFEPLQIDLRGR